MKHKIVYENGIAFLPGAKAVATSYKKTEDAATEKVVIPKDYSSWPWSPWGDDNLFPQNVLIDLEKNSIALRALEKRKTVHYSQGILAYRDNTTATGILMLAGGLALVGIGKATLTEYVMFAPKILRFEGGVVNDPKDKGGATNMGVTLETVPLFSVKASFAKIPLSLTG